MKEMEGMKAAFNIFVDSCEKAGVKFSKEEKQVEEWPMVGDKYFFKTIYGDIGFNKFCEMGWSIYQTTKLTIFKTKESAEKYYSIIDTINEIVDELGRPSWEDFEGTNIRLFSIGYDFTLGKSQETWEEVFYSSNNFFPWCIKAYSRQLLEKVSEDDLLWAFKKSMRLV